MHNLFYLALFVFFIVTALKDFGVVFKYWDFVRGVAGIVIIAAVVAGQAL